MKVMDRVVVTKAVMGICHMQVCAVADATDEEILDVCNSKNPSGTQYGWGRVIRENEPVSDFWPTEKLKPITCADDSERKHFVVAC